METPTINQNQQESQENLKAYKIEKQGDVLKLSFGSPAQNDQIVKDAVERLREMEQNGDLEDGEIIKLNGPASLPVAIAIAQAVSKHYEVVSAFDPKINKYVVAISKNPEVNVGDLID